MRKRRKISAMVASMRFILICGTLALALVVVVGWALNQKDLPGPSSMSGTELESLAAGQARLDADPHVVSVDCPQRAYRVGSEVACTAHLELVHSVKESRPLEVRVARDSDGDLYVDVGNR
jgi:hypothetical protein